MEKRNATRTVPVTAGEFTKGPDTDIHLGGQGVTLDPQQSHADEKKMADELNKTDRWEASPRPTRTWTATPPTC